MIIFTLREWAIERAVRNRRFARWRVAPRECCVQSSRTRKPPCLPNCPGTESAPPRHSRSGEPSTASALHEDLSRRSYACGFTGRIGLALVLSVVGTSLGSAQQQLAEPFTPSARWSHYIHRTYGPVRLGVLAADTAIDHALREPACWDSAAGSYGRRYARAFERRAIRNTAELATGLLTGEDLRYHASRSPLIQGRVWSALRASVTAQMPNGTKRPAYTRFFASALANVSTAHWTRQPIQPRWLLQSLAWSSLDQVQTNLLDEFSPDLRRIGVRIWKRVRPH